WNRNLFICFTVGIHQNNGFWEHRFIPRGVRRMKHHPRNILEQPSIHEVFHESSEEMRSAMGILNRNTRGVRHAFTRLFPLVLTLLLVWLHLLRNLLIFSF